MANPPDSPIERQSAFDDPPLPPGLWPRVARARRRQWLAQRVALGGGIVATCALLLLPLRLPDPGAMPGDGRATPVATAEPVPTRAPAMADPAVRLRILDRALQDAYRRGSDATEIAQLWEARAALLRKGTPGLPVRPVRI